MFKELFWFECKRCGKTFRSYVTGHYINNCHEFCFYDVIIGEIHNNSYLLPLLNVRECRACKKGVDLLQYV